MRRGVTLVLGAAASIAAPLWVFAEPAPTSPQAATTIDPQQIVDARRAGMGLSAADIQLMRTAGEKGADIRPMARAARSLSAWGQVFPALFPAGTGPESVQTRARAEIWANRADFEQRARVFSEAAGRLADAAAAGDMTTGRVEWDATWEACNGCHERYRSEALSSPTR
jgi:cytochrome c556